MSARTTTTNAVTPTVAPASVMQAYTMHCQAIQAAGQISAKPAYAVQALLLQGNAITPEQQAAYDAFAALVTQAQQASMAVKGKAIPCSVFNYLDGRVTGHKVATSLGNSVSLRTFMAGMVTLAEKAAATVTPANAPTTKASKKTARKAQAATPAQPAPFDTTLDSMPTMA